jgi:predicted Zn finger-like uncharacterized protein
MKITCSSCQAKYTIADEKVAGKIVKIRCKKCSSTIIVNGDSSSSSPPESMGPGDLAGGEWSVHVAEGDQRTMSQVDVVTAYQNGTIDDETFCWKDGMSDWLPLREIEGLYQACHSPVQASQNGAADVPELAAAPVAARRAGGRAGGDLFGSAAQAGGEHDVMTSAPERIPEPHLDPRTGARNENSVLFSLSALTSKGPDANRPLPMPGSEQSGLIDIRQLSAQMGKPEAGAKRSKVDDIMNLSGGGAFAPSLESPVLAAPSLDQYAAPADGSAGPAPAAGRKKMLLVGAGGFVLVAGALAVAFMVTGGKGADAKGASAAPASASAAMTAAAPAATAAATAAPAASETAAAAPSAAPAASSEATEAPKTAAPKPAAAPAAAAPAPAPKPVAAAPKPAAGNSLAAAMAAGAAPAPAAAPAAAAESDQPFNMGEAKSRLAAMASNVDSCKKPNGPTGTGRVVVTFAPSGAAQSAVVSGPPFEGTPTGTCVGAKFRGVRVPAFGGSPFSVSKSFTIN